METLGNPSFVETIEIISLANLGNPWKPLFTTHGWLKCATMPPSIAPPSGRTRDARGPSTR